MKRILGLLLILRALTPLLAAATIIWAASEIAGSLQQTIEPPLHRLQTEMDGIGQTIATAWQQFENAAGTATGTIGALASRLQDFALPTLSANELGILLGGLANPVNDLFRGIERVFRPFGDMLTSISALGQPLQAVPQHFRAALDQIDALTGQLRNVIDRWGSLIIAAGVLILILVIIYNIAPIIDDLARGWRMLRGSPRTR
jgi:DNA anti-recombination protein RmuC